ncbi:TIGR03617 family F420-dependent LLM class oxidoreductase [Williamsia deligens]|uniref:TIGR03617 family F420-dependent LLM class oxidoreductase n=1 Tax=Williamsia deligens TaxID=321325 RepID=A0ABW3G771_9NOCA|nr:TIGR03617 family F420-dependent LLM class oxidoreductase [Williamsia deligens]MCP2194339.1 putative F420-dependent oxidoreductase, MSMEG_2256 family [Williamsia deligens]
MRVHLQLTGTPGAVDDDVVALSGLGVDGVFTFEGPHDVFAPLVRASAVPQAAGLDLMTNVAIAGPRSPLHLAHLAWDLQSYSGGRFRLGLGSQIRPHIEKRYGATWGRPAARLGETVRAIGAIFDTWENGVPLDFRGEFTTHTLMPPNFVPAPTGFGRPAVLMGALGPVMTRTAAEVADGLLVMPFHSRRHLVDRTLPAVDAGLGSRSRKGDFAVVGQAMVAVGSDETSLRAAVDGVAMLIAFYGSTPAYRPVLEASGRGDLQPELNALSKQGRFAEMRALVTDDDVATFAVVGSPAECAAEILDRFGEFAADVCCYFPHYEPVSSDLSALVRHLQEPVVPSAR